MPPPLAEQSEGGVPYAHVAIVVTAMAGTIVFLVGWIRNLWIEAKKENADRETKNLALIERVVTVNERTTQAIVALTAEVKTFAERYGRGKP